MAQESLLTSIPDNGNFLQQTKYTFTIPSLPFAKYFCQTVLMPGIATNEVLVPTPFADTYRHGDKLMYDALTLTFLVDEDLRTWEDTYIWLITLTNPFKFKQYANRFTEKYYDGYLEIKTNSNIPNIRVKFTNCHPTQLGAIQFDHTVTADITPICDMTIRYDQMVIERL